MELADVGDRLLVADAFSSQEYLRLPGGLGG